MELDMHVPVGQPVDIALHDTFAQSQGDGDGVSRLLANPRVGKVVVYTWNFQEVLTTQGLSNAEIATRTSLSIISIKSFIRTGYRRIEVTTRAQAVLWGATHTGSSRTGTAPLRSDPLRRRRAGAASVADRRGRA